MNESASPPDLDDQLLLNFQNQYEPATNRSAVLSDWCRRHPHLAKRLRVRAEMFQLLAQPPAADEPPPVQLGEFQIVRRLGVSMGEVFEAWQPSLKRRVAIKTIRRGRISPQARDRFLREQRVLAGLHQTHIVPIFAAGEEAGLQYFVMPYIDGAALHHVVNAARTLGAALPNGQTPPLKELARLVAESQRSEVRDQRSEVGSQRSEVGSQKSAQQGTVTADDTPAVTPSPCHLVTLSPCHPITPSSLPVTPQLSPAYFRSVAEVMADAADALQHAHDARILHRDLKPSNLMVDRQGHCWIIDFGLAGLVGQDRNPVLQSSPLASALTPLTTSGVMGTPPYMAPEQWDGDADERTDVYGLGVTLYELLTLCRAFDGPDRDAIKRRMAGTSSARPRAVVPRVPADLDAICRKAMHKESARRYTAPRELADDLRRWLRGQPTQARPAWWPRRLALWAKRNRGWAAAVVLLFVAVALGAAAAGVIQERNREADRQILLRQAQGRRLNVHTIGWSQKAWALVGQAAAIRVDHPLRNEASSSLIGVDAVLAKEFKNEGACSAAFDASGKKLILGAQPLRKNYQAPKKQTRPIRIWDQETDQVRETKIFGEGPVAFDKKQRAIALTANEDLSALVVWDLDKEEPLRELKLPAKAKGKLENWVLSTNGATAAAVVNLDGATSSVLAWDIDAGSVLREFASKPGSIVALSPDGAALAIGECDGTVQLCDPRGKNDIRSWKAGRVPLSALALGTNPRRSLRESPWVLATGNQGGTIVVWDVADQSVRASMQGSAHHVLALTFSADGAWLASSGRSEPRIWNAATGRLQLELPFHDFATALAFSPQGSHLAIANEESPFYGLDIRVVRIESGRDFQSLHGLAAQIEFVEFSKDGSLIAALSHEWQIGVWDAKTGRLLHVFLPRSAQWADNTGLAMSDDNQTLALTTNQQAHLWDLRSGKEQTIPLNPGMVDRLAFHSGMGKFISFRVETKGGKEWPLAAKTNYREHPRVCRIRTLTRAGFEDIGEILDFNCSIVHAGIARNGSMIAVSGKADDQNGLTRAMRVYSLPDRKEILHVPTSLTGGGVNATPLDPDGKVVFAIAFDDEGRRISQTLVNLKTLATRDWPYAPLCLSPDGVFALGHENDTLRTIGVHLHRGASKTPLATFATNFSSGFAAQFTRTGNRFAWGTTEGTVVVGDLAAIQAKLAELNLGW